MGRWGKEGHCIDDIDQRSARLHHQENYVFFKKWARKQEAEGNSVRKANKLIKELSLKRNSIEVSADTSEGKWGKAPTEGEIEKACNR